MLPGEQCSWWRGRIRARQGGFALEKSRFGQQSQRRVKRYFGELSVTADEVRLPWDLGGLVCRVPRVMRHFRSCTPGPEQAGLSTCSDRTAQAMKEEGEHDADVKKA